VLALDWADEATDDLADIQVYLEERNPIAAMKVHDAIAKGAELLAFMPLAFRVGRVTGTREYLAHPSYFLVYSVNSTTVTILRVMHTKRQYP